MIGIIFYKPNISVTLTCVYLQRKMFSVYVPRYSVNMYVYLNIFIYIYRKTIYECIICEIWRDIIILRLIGLVYEPWFQCFFTLFFVEILAKRGDINWFSHVGRAVLNSEHRSVPHIVE